MKVARRAAGALVLGIVAASAWAQSGSVREILGLLRAGGYVIVVRHGATHADQADTDPLNPAHVDKQRQLNDKGRADAKAMGEVFRTRGCANRQVHSSRFQRAVETARFIAGKEPTATSDVTEGGLVVSPNENSPPCASLACAHRRGA